MGLSRNILLRASENHYLLTHVPNYRFVRKALKKFMPGEEIDDAVKAARLFQGDRIPAVFTYLGESIRDLNEAAQVRDHYISLLERIDREKLDVEISVKLTQLGLDLTTDHAYENFERVAEKALALHNIVWIDMERSSYVDSTLQLYKKVKRDFANTGVCLQSYLRRTKQDVLDLLPMSPLIRLVKGAYKEPKEMAFHDKRDVDTNYFELSQILLKGVSQNGVRVAFGTHDAMLHRRIIKVASEVGVTKEKVEIQMLYGIKTEEQKRLASDGYNIRVLVSYGKAWYKWYVRRLAERPANVGFVLKNLFTS